MLGDEHKAPSQRTLRVRSCGSLSLSPCMGVFQEDAKINVPFKERELCRINVAGKEYITTFDCLDRYPQTLLGSPDREKYFIQDLNAYFFNRNRACFQSILSFYQTGIACPVPNHVCLDLYQNELAFFRIPGPPDSNTEEEVVETGGFLAYCPAQIERKGRVLYNTIMDPRSSIVASCWHLLDIFLIFISISFMILETDPNLGKKYFVYESTEFEPVMVGKISVNNIIFGINGLVIMFFTLDIVIRFLTWPGFLSFWRNIFNVLDILSIMPFYISVITHRMHPDEPGSHDSADEEQFRQKYVILKMCRIFRVVRVFKFVKHSKDLIMIMKVLISAKKELGLLVILLGISTVTFGSIIYYVENEQNVMFDSIMSGCWWAIVTITTLGYGDMYPITVGGKILGSLLLTFGMVFLTLPMTIIVSKFGTVYESHKRSSVSRSDSSK